MDVLKGKGYMSRVSDKYRKNTLNNMNIKKINLKPSMFNNPMSFIGHYIIKRVLSQTWWGSILLLGYEYLYDSKILTHIINIFSISSPKKTEYINNELIPNLTGTHDNLIVTNTNDNELISNVTNIISQSHEGHSWLYYCFESSVVIGVVTGTCLLLGPGTAVCAGISGAVSYVVSYAIPAATPSALAYVIPKATWAVSCIYLHNKFGSTINDLWNSNNT